MVEITSEDIRQQKLPEGKKQFLVVVADLVCRHVTVEATSQEEALELAGHGVWDLPGDVEFEEVVDRQAEEVLEERECT